MVGKAHTIRCSHDECPEISTRVPFRPEDPEKVAADHRKWLVTSEDWTDFEGRMYCQDHPQEV